MVECKKIFCRWVTENLIPSGLVDLAKGVQSRHADNDRQVASDASWPNQEPNSVHPSNADDQRDIFGLRIGIRREVDDALDAPSARARRYIEVESSPHGSVGFREPTDHSAFLWKRWRILLILLKSAANLYATVSLLLRLFRKPIRFFSSGNGGVMTKIPTSCDVSSQVE